MAQVCCSQTSISMLCQQCHSPLLTMSSFRRSRSCAVFGSLLGDLAGGAACSSVCNGGPAKHASIGTIQNSVCLQFVWPMYLLPWHTYLCIQTIKGVKVYSGGDLRQAEGAYAGAFAACICRERCCLQRHARCAFCLEQEVHNMPFEASVAES